MSDQPQQGLLGETTCTKCQWLSKNALFFVVGAIAIYYIVRYVKAK